MNKCYIFEKYIESSFRKYNDNVWDPPPTGEKIGPKLADIAFFAISGIYFRRWVRTTARTIEFFYSLDSKLLIKKLKTLTEIPNIENNEPKV